VHPWYWLATAHRGAASGELEEFVMATGTVKWFDSKKGFGFVVNPEGKDVFVHFTSIVGEGFRALKEGEMVEYEEVAGNKGLSAQQVRRLVQQVKRRQNDSAH